MSKNLTPTHFLYLLVLLVVGFLSCSSHSGDGRSNKERPSTAQAPLKPLFPLAVGKQWSYLSTTYDSLGKVTASRKVRTTVVRDTVVGGERWFILEDDSSGVPMGVANRQDGLYMLGPDGSGIVLYKYPANVGDVSPPYSIVSIDTTVSCRAGRFNSYQYQCVIGGQADTTHPWRVTIDDFVAPGVGLVKHEVRKEWGEGERTVAGGRDVTELVGM